MEGEQLKMNRQFFDERWSKHRTVTSLDWSTQVTISNAINTTTNCINFNRNTDNIFIDDDDDDDYYDYDYYDDDHDCYDDDYDDDVDDDDDDDDDDDASNWCALQEALY